VKQEKIRDIIGPGARRFGASSSRTGVKADVEDSGMVSRFPNFESIEAAIAMIKKLTQEVEVWSLWVK
jgi:polyribonucleotide nucleotidyltransferase